jgi:hypothetical protein
MDFYLIAKETGWTWGAWEDTPPVVRDVVWTYLQGEAEARKEAQEG